MLWCPPFQHICYIPHPHPYLPTPSISPTPIHITHPQLHPYNSWQRGSKHPLIHFQPMFHFDTPQKTSENRMVSDVFRVYRSATLAENGLKILHWFGIIISSLKAVTYVKLFGTQKYIEAATEVAR